MRQNIYNFEIIPGFVTGSHIKQQNKNDEMSLVEIRSPEKDLDFLCILLQGTKEFCIRK